jgi:hypothetical protein
MNPVTVGVVVFACVFGAALAGIWLRTVLPKDHLGNETKDSVRLGMGLVATMSALVLGLLVASAKDSYDKEKSEVIGMAAKVGYLDRVLSTYGPEAAQARTALRGAATRVIESMWPQDRVLTSQLDPAVARGDDLYGVVQALVPQTDVQRALKAEATGLMSNLGQARWLLFEQAGSPVSTPLLIIVVTWLAILFISFGLFAPANHTAITALLVAALSVAGAIFLILELAQPFDGLIQIPSAPMRNVLQHLSR